MIYAHKLNFSVLPPTFQNVNTQISHFMLTNCSITGNVIIINDMQNASETYLNAINLQFLGVCAAHGGVQRDPSLVLPISHTLPICWHTVRSSGARKKNDSKRVE